MALISDPGNTRSVFPGTIDSFKALSDGFDKVNSTDAEIFNKATTAILRTQEYTQKNTRYTNILGMKTIRLTKSVTISRNVGPGTYAAFGGPSTNDKDYAQATTIPLTAGQKAFMESYGEFSSSYLVNVATTASTGNDVYRATPGHVDANGDIQILITNADRAKMLGDGDTVTVHLVIIGR